MHIVRKELCLRMFVVLSLLVGVGYHGMISMITTVEKSAGIRVSPVKVKNVDLPPEYQKELIAGGISLVSEQGRGGQVTHLISSLVEKKQDKVERATLSMLVQGEEHQYAMINNRMYRVGDSLPDGRKIVSMDSRGVLLSALGRTQLLPWIPPLKVKLKKSAPQPVTELQSDDKATIVENPLTNSDQKVVMDAQKALELLKKLEATDEKKK